MRPKQTNPAQPVFPRAASTLCQTCGGHLATDACPTHTTVYNIHDIDINLTTTGPVYQSFGPSTNQGNAQYGEYAMGPGVENAMHSQGPQYSDNGQDNYPQVPETSATYLPISTYASQWPTVRPVGSDAITIAAKSRRKIEAKFHCPFEECKKTFTAKHNLDSHEKAHLDIRPHQCVCGSEFTAFADLKRHWKSLKHKGDNQVHLLRK